MNVDLKCVTWSSLRNVGNKILLILMVNSPWPWHYFNNLILPLKKKKNAWSTHSEHSYSHRVVFAMSELFFFFLKLA